jgi:exopolysaccharide production protein ExoQ
LTDAKTLPNIHTKGAEGVNAMAKGSPAAGKILSVLALMTLPVAVVAPLGLAPGILAAGLAAIIVARRDRPWAAIDRMVYVFPLALLVWGLVSALWAIEPSQTIRTTLRLAPMVIVGGAMLGVVAGNRPGLDRFPLFLAIGLCLALVVLAVDYWTGSARLSSALYAALKGRHALGVKSGFNRSATVVALVMWPAAIAVWRRYGRWPALGLIAVSALVLLTGDSLASRLSVIIGAVVYGAFLVMPAKAARLACLVVTVVVLALPMGLAAVPPPAYTMQEWRWLPLSAHHRLTIWMFVAERIREKPLLGWGLDSSRSIPGAEDEITVERRDGDVVVAKLIETRLPLHPHNAALQIWLELGAVGIAVTLAFLWWLFVRIARMPDGPARAAAAATLTSAIIVSMVSYGFWQYWWQATLWAAALCCYVNGRRE